MENEIDLKHKYILKQSTGFNGFTSVRPLKTSNDISELCTYAIEDFKKRSPQFARYPFWDGVRIPPGYKVEEL